MNTKKHVIVALSIFVMIVFTLSLLSGSVGSAKKDDKEIKKLEKKVKKNEKEIKGLKKAVLALQDNFDNLEERIVALEVSSGAGFPDYSGVIAGTWVGITYYNNWRNPEEGLIKEYGPISITFKAPDGEGQGTYSADDLNPFVPDNSDIVLTGNYQIKGDFLVLLVPSLTGGNNLAVAEILNIQGNKMIWGWAGKRGYYEKR